MYPFPETKQQGKLSALLKIGLYRKPLPGSKRIVSHSKHFQLRTCGKGLGSDFFPKDPWDGTAVFWNILSAAPCQDAIVANILVATVTGRRLPPKVYKPTFYHKIKHHVGK